MSSVRYTGPSTPWRRPCRNGWSPTAAAKTRPSRSGAVYSLGRIGRIRRWGADAVSRVCLLAIVVLAAACAQAPSSPPPAEPTPPQLPPVRESQAPAPTTAAVNAGVIAQNERFVIYLPKRGDTLPSLARRFLADDARAREVAEFNGIAEIEPGQPVVIVLRPQNPVGVYPDGYQTVPILSYHRFGPKDGRMVVTPEAFSAQLDYLARNDYQVIRLADLADFLNGMRPLPRRSVVITMDDGYASMYEHAFPLLKKHRFPATVFVYTDFVGARDALSWEQMAEMKASGLVDIQSHSKTHANLSYRLPGESEGAYRQRLATEVRAPAKLLQQKLSTAPVSFAYPFGDTNEQVMDQLVKADYKLAVTVDPGSNAFFAHPLMLKRSMVFGDQDLGAFIAKLQVYRTLDGQ